MPRFAILEHDHPTLHWDLLLEAGDVLKAWRLAQAPTASLIEAAEIADHRVMYLDYEGPVSGDRGFVKRWDAGVFAEEPDSTQDVRCLRFEGLRLQTRIKLTRIQGTHWQWGLVTS